MAKIIFPNGAELEVMPSNGTDFSLSEMQAVVGGYIEVLRLDNKELIVVNEEGKLMGLDVNDKATRYMKANSRYDDVLVGNVLVCNMSQVR